MPKTVKPKKPTFGVSVNVVNLQLNVEVESDTLETALAEVRAMKVGDLLDLPEGVTINDHEGTKVVGVYGY